MKTATATPADKLMAGIKAFSASNHRRVVAATAKGAIRILNAHPWAVDAMRRAEETAG